MNGTPEARATTTRPRPNLTDAGNAERFALQHGEWARFCWPWRAWLLWSGTHWRKDDGDGSIALAKATARAIYQEAAGAASPEERERIAKWASKSESARGLSAMLDLARAEPGIPVRPEQLDTDPWVLNCANGSLDLKTGTLRRHRREDLLTKLIQIPYDPGAGCPVWEAFLERIFGGQQPLIAFIQRAIGYALTGDTREQCFFILWGAGSNGKSTLIETTTALLDVYAQRIAAETLLAKPRDSLALNDLFTLLGARFVAACEPDMGRTLAEGLVKQLTGEDTIKAKKLYVDLFSYKPVFKLWLATNHRPIIRGRDHAIWRRIRLIPFGILIPDAEQDKALPQRLKGELSGILTWAVRGCLDWQQNGLGTPEEVHIATAEYKSEMDMLADFLHEKCVLDPAARIPARELYTVYDAWAHLAGEKPVPEKMFSRRLTEHELVKQRTAKGQVWLGIRLRSVTDQEPDWVTEPVTGDAV